MIAKMTQKLYFLERNSSHENGEIASLISAIINYQHDLEIADREVMEQSHHNQRTIMRSRHE